MTDVRSTSFASASRRWIARDALARCDIRLSQRVRRPHPCAHHAAAFWLGSLLVLAAGAVAWCAEPATWQRKLQAQQQTRAAAEALVANLLEAQLQQLEENGLTALPVYREIAEMKRHLGEIASQPMDQIAQLLQQLAEAPAAEQPAIQQKVREKVREVVSALMAERQRIYRRLKVAHLAADVRELLARQTRTQAATQALPGAEASQRPTLALAVREDQADVHRWYYQLLAALEDVRGWGGPAAESAARGLALLRVAQTEAALRAVAEALAQADYPAAVQGQQTVVEALSLLLSELESSQGLDAAGRDAALAKVRELAAQQQALRQQTHKTASAGAQAVRLVDGQTALHRQLAQLASLLRRFPAAAPLVQAAQEAAMAAARELFQERPEAAAAQQAEVLTHLSHLEQLLEAEEAQFGDKSAAALAAEVARLEALHEALQRLGKAWPAAADRALELTALADGLAAARPLAESGPAPVATQFSQTQERVLRWQEQRRQAASPDALSTAADAAQRAFTQLQAEVTAALADTQRRQRAVAVGELARAAETLERAAATERDIARHLEQPAAHPPPASPSARETTGETAASHPSPATGLLAQEQQQVAALTAKVAQGVEHTAPSVHQELLPLAAALKALAERIAAAEDAPLEEPQRKAAAAEAQTHHAALVEAAARLRRAQGQAAMELQTLAQQQRAQTESVRQQVERAHPDDDATAGHALAAWQAAADALQEARLAALQAAGRSAQAAAQRLQDQLAQTRVLEAAAQSAAEELASGRAPDPLAAAMAQQAVADRLAELAAVTSPLRSVLQRASAQASQAARELLLGRHLAAQAAQRALQAALTEADQALPSYLAQAQAMPAGPPDAKARQALAQHLEQAAKAMQGAAGASDTKGPSPQAAAVAQQLQAAASALSASTAPEQPALDPVLKTLAEAQSHVQASLQAAGQQQRETLARQAAAAQSVQPAAAQADAGAAAALAQAEALARRAAAPTPTQPPPLEASARVEEKWEQAVANLLAREGRLRRDEELAQLLASLALAQQAARETIAQISQQLQQPPTPQPADPDQAAAHAAQRQELAGQLMQAEHQFAFAQTVTGQAATEVSGQIEVANVPLREALQLASALRLPQPVSELPASEPPERASGDPSASAGDASSPPSSTASGQPPGKSDASASQSSSGSSKAQGQPGPPAGASPSAGQGTPSASRGVPSSQGAEERSLGTQFVPASPQVTARQIAGPQAQAAAAEAAGMGQEGQGASGQGQGSSGMGDSPSPEGSASASARKGGAVQKGPASPNQKSPPGELQTAEAAQADSRGKLTAEGTQPGGVFPGGAEVWMARLPPELRSAIQARSRRLAPRGYEERLKRYFENVP